MENSTNKAKTLVQCGVMVAFAAMALACGSSKDANDFRDGFREGWNYSTGQALNDAPADSVVAPELPEASLEMASND